MKLSIKFALPIIIFMLGCGAQPYIKRPAGSGYNEKPQTAAERQKKGYILLSVTQSNRKANSTFYMTKLDNGKRLYVDALSQGFFGFGESDFKLKQGRLFLMEVDAGDYAFQTWHVNTGNASIHPREEPDPIKFEVKPQEIVYVGEIFFHLRLGENMFGVEMVFGAYPEIINSSERDYELFKSRFPKLVKLPYSTNVEELEIWFAKKSQEKADELNRY